MMQYHGFSVVFVYLQEMNPEKKMAKLTITKVSEFPGKVSVNWPVAGLHLSQVNPDYFMENDN